MDTFTIQDAAIQGLEYHTDESDGYFRIFHKVSEEGVINFSKPVKNIKALVKFTDNFLSTVDWTVTKSKLTNEHYTLVQKYLDTVKYTKKSRFF